MWCTWHNNIMPTVLLTLPSQWWFPFCHVLSNFTSLPPDLNDLPWPPPPRSLLLATAITMDELRVGNRGQLILLLDGWRKDHRAMLQRRGDGCSPHAPLNVLHSAHLPPAQHTTSNPQHQCWHHDSFVGYWFRYTPAGYPYLQQSITHISRNLYPYAQVWVYWGRSGGFSEKPQGYPWQSLSIIANSTFTYGIYIPVKSSK